MPREAELSTNERSFVLNALEQGYRADGRKYDQHRPLDLIFGKEYGAVELSLGNTVVAVRISCTVTVPYPERKFDGIFTINCEFSPMTSPVYEVGRQNQSETLLSRMLEKTIRRSSALDTESLCIVAGSKCFALRADIHILNHDGNLIDASCIALVAALQHFRRPDVSIEGEKVTIYNIRDREPIPLSMLHHPLCITFSFFNDGSSVLVDVSLAEEQVRETHVIVGMNKHGELCQLTKYGGSPVDPYALINCSKQALPKVQELSRFIESRLAADAKARDSGGLMNELKADNDR